MTRGLELERDREWGLTTCASKSSRGSGSGEGVCPLTWMRVGNSRPSGCSFSVKRGGHMLLLENADIRFEPT